MIIANTKNNLSLPSEIENKTASLCTTKIISAMHSDPRIFSHASSAADVSTIFMIGFTSIFTRGITIYGISWTANSTSPNTQKPKY